MRHWLFSVCWAALIFGILSPSSAYAQDSDTSMVSSTMPFELLSDFLVVVRGQIGVLDGLQFIVDTGTTRSAIDRKVALRLGLRLRAGEVMNFNRHIPIQWTDLPEIRVGPIRAEGVRVMVVRLAEYSEFGGNLDGIIGLDLLTRSKKFNIDYERKILSFQLGEVENGDRPLPGCLKIPVVVQGLTMHLAVDTGFQGILLYKDRLRKQLPKLRIEGKSLNVAIGRSQATQVRLPGVRFEGTEVVTTVILIDGPGEDAMPGVDGYLGPSSLHVKRLEFDFAAKALRWQ
jgi:predicted aspartyl protease